MGCRSDPPGLASYTAQIWITQQAYILSMGTRTYIPIPTVPYLVPMSGVKDPDLYPESGYGTSFLNYRYRNIEKIIFFISYCILNVFLMNLKKKKQKNNTVRYVKGMKAQDLERCEIMTTA